MNQRKGNLTEKDHRDLDAFLERVLDAYKNNEITRDSARSSLAHVMTALDIGNYGEVLSWLRKENEGFIHQS